MERRDVLKALALGVAGAISTNAMAQGMDHEHMHHHMGADAANAELINTSSECIKAGEACLNHCLYLLGQGDKDMAGCAKSVNEMLAVCTALMKLASQNSKSLPAMAKLAADVCASCEKECRKHAKKHEECKACADACAKCLKACKAVG